ncbi:MULTISPECIES: 2-oxoacid:acceptor oxidoreductase subunit alpha [Methanothermobacter]|uniref:2-oxoglutarate synthase subunit KorA n=1 Tax=Methanothermobacter marburgensis (strain ATCC BAA-927 / DSM 2133 / JCM 14651 / NBRC 100331 / OCM 82 / Marburg) TaxID=79929 RepID=KORA_METTM|nr:MULTISPECIES: 2-oxoacid:acceptor oxidoreductase subunit alpha [Methanothermobacter]P80904.2 RecName: Full=2-oxoglutarate synthase subunit KorA; AltName: Full=2-ketoglutarate oxidoreductase alpha chain; Short=KOR; AltName: Full=2-oxoglutarate-ferredoxin oxidoreductase subunit alpha [Methanothermobacter marburgensis str. Marburg]ADL59002.1 2-oxoglutarate synthase, subunit alpha [Methanothermobacter marburgensis str. Marburg]QEF94817.1 2-oxoacid:acceptor oxidoreductase subunit alpha [Methanother
MTEEYFIQGNDACARGAISAGCRFFAGYPITPSTEIAEEMAVLLPGEGGVFVQMEDEIGALGAVIGAVWGGVKGMTATSGPGFSLMQEHVGYAAMTETPLVIVDVQRGSPSTGQPTMASQSDMMQARWGSHGDYEIIALSPSSVQECFDFTVRAFNLAEEYRVPVVVLSDEIVGHMREKITIPDKVEIRKRKSPTSPPGEFIPFKPQGDFVPEMPAFGDGYRVPVTGLTHDERGYPDASNPEGHEKLVKRLCDKILNHRDKIVDVQKGWTDDADITVISYGAPSRSVATAVKMARSEGVRAGYIKINTPWPFPETEIREAAESSRKLLVVEMNLGQMFYEVQRVASGMAEVELLPKIGGEIHRPDEILNKIMGMK